MKRLLHIFVIAMLCASISKAQTIRVFNNASGDGLWSNNANWTVASGGVAPSAGEFAQMNATPSTVNTDFSIGQIRNFGTSPDIEVNGGSILTIDTNEGSAKPGILNLNNNGQKLLLNCPVVINNTTGSTATFLTLNNSENNSLEFGSAGSLTINSNVQTGSQANNPNRTFIFNNSLGGSGNLIFGNTTNNSFAATADNTNYGGTFVCYANASVTVNMADDAVFISEGQKVQVNGNNGSLIINSANVYNGNISLAASNNFTLDVNKNQGSMGGIVLASGTLTIDVDDAVTALTFSNNSSYNWGTGAVVINGFKENVIRFGTDAAGLTIEQLGQINVGGQSVMLDENGYLVYGTPTDIDDVKSDDVRIAYPTITRGLINFKEPIDGVKVVNMTGSLVKNISATSTSIDISDLTDGMYLLVYPDNSVEKVIKK